MKLKINPAAYIKHRFGNEASVAFMPNGGNLGDNLIAAATIQAFEKAGIDWRLLKGGKENIRSSDVLVHGGGGSLVGMYEGAINSLNFLLTLNRPLVVFPQTVRGHEKFWADAPEMTVFCRDEISYNYLRQYSQIEVLLADDMASDLDMNLMPYLAVKEYRRKLLEKNIDLFSLDVFRHDGESAGTLTTDKSLDISDLAYPSMKSRSEIDALAVMFLMSVASAANIQTDRLHIAVASGLLGISVNFFDNVYGKNKDVYLSTLKEKFPSIQLVSKEDK